MVYSCEGFPPWPPATLWMWCTQRRQIRTVRTRSNDWNLFHFFYFFTIVVCAEHHGLLGGTRNTYTRIHTHVRTHIYIYILGYAVCLEWMQGHWATACCRLVERECLVPRSSELILRHLRRSIRVTLQVAGGGHVVRLWAFKFDVEWRNIWYDRHRHRYR